MKKYLPVAVIALAACALVAHTLVWNFVTDDAYISFVYSRNLVEAGQLVFNLGERVEGYTNFLWTILLAGLLKVGLQPELMSRVLGTAFAAVTLFVCAQMVKSVRRSVVPSMWDAVPALFLCTSPGYACWSSGGLETQMFTCFFTLGAARYLRAALDVSPLDAQVGLWFGLAALTRPEGVLFFALTTAHRLGALLLRKRVIPPRGDFVALGAFLALVVPHLVWRRAYYGWWLPNTFYIKASGGAGAWSQGGYYLLRMAEALHVWVVLPIVLTALVVRPGDRTLRLIASYTLFVCGVFYVYVASVGGDFMGLFRFALPVVPLAFVLGTVALRAITQRISLRPLAGVVAAGLFLVAHAVHAVPVTRRAQQIGADRGIDTPGFLRWYTADRAAIGRWFGARRQPDDFAAVGGAGAQVYYSRMPSLDCFGLSDEHIAHEVRAVSTRPGHQKYAPLEYQLARRPTIITSNYYRCCSPAFAHAPYRPTPSEEADWARRGYRYVGVKVPGLSYPYYSFLLRNDRSIEGHPAPPPPGEEREPVIQLRMRGLPASLFASALVAAWPGAFVLYERLVKHAPIEPLLFWLSVGVAFVPWISRLVARVSYRAALDDVALHLAGDALPWNTITRVREVHSWRRSLLVVERGRTSRFTLVTRDLFAGRLEPIDELWKRLPEAARPARAG